MNPLPDKSNRSNPPTHVGIVSGLTRLGLLGGAGYALSKFAKIKPGMIFEQTGLESVGSKSSDLEEVAANFYNRYKDYPEAMQKDLQQIMNYSPYKDVVPKITEADDLLKFVQGKNDLTGMLAGYARSFDPSFEISDLGSKMSAGKQVTDGGYFLNFKDLFAQHNLNLSPAEQEAIAKSFESIRNDKFKGHEIGIKLYNDVKTKRPRSAAVLFSNQSGTSMSYHLDIADEEGRMFVSDKSSTYFTARKFKYLDNEIESITTAQARAYATRGNADDIRQTMLRAAVYDDMSIAREDTISHLIRKGQVLHFSLNDNGPVFNSRVEDIGASASPMSKQFPVKSLEESSLINRLLGYAASEKNPRQSLGYGNWVGIKDYNELAPYLSKVSTNDLMDINVENYLQIKRGFVGKDIWNRVSQKGWFGERFRQVEEDEMLMTPKLKAIGNQTPHSYKVVDFGKDAELTLYSAHSKYQAGGGKMNFMEWLDSDEPSNYFRQNPIDIGENFNFGKDPKKGYIVSREFNPTRERLVGYNNADRSFAVEQIFGIDEGQKFMNNKVTALFAKNDKSLVAAGRFSVALSHYGSEQGNHQNIMREIERMLLSAKVSAKAKKNFSKSGLVHKLIDGNKKAPKILQDFALFQKEMGYASSEYEVSGIQVVDKLKKNMISGDKSAQKMRNLYKDALIRAQRMGLKDPELAQKLAGMGHTYTAGGRLVYDSRGRGPVNLVDAYNKITSLIGENTGYTSDILMAPPVPAPKMGFGGHTSVTRPILDNVSTIFGDQAVGIKQELVETASGMQSDLLELTTNILDAESYGKDTPSISLGDFVSNRNKYMPEHVGSRGRIVVNLPGNQHIAVPTAEYKSGLYTDKTGTDISKQLQSAFDEVINVAQSGDVQQTTNMLKHYKDLQMEAWRQLNKDKAVGGLSKYSYQGQVQSAMFKEEDWGQIADSLKHAPHRKAAVETFGEDFVKAIETPHARQYLLESNSQQLRQLGIKGNAGTVLISKNPNFMGSTSGALVFDRDLFQNFLIDRKLRTQFDNNGMHTVGVSKSLRDAPFWDLDQDIIDMQSVRKPENSRTIMDQIMDEASATHKLRKLGESSFKILNTSGAKEALAREYYDAGSGLFSKEFLTAAFQTNKLSFVDIGTLYNKMQIIQAAGQEMGGEAGTSLGESTKLIQEMVLKAGGKGASGVKEAGEFFSQLDLIQAGQRAPHIGPLMDQMMGADRLTGEAATRYQTVKGALLDEGIQAKIADAARRFKSSSGIKTPADIIESMLDPGMNTLHKALGPKIAERFPNQAKRTVLDRATEAISETAAPARKYLNKKGLMGLAIGAIALRTLAGSSGHKVPDIEPESNPIGQNPSFSHPGQGSRIPKLVMGNGNQSMDIRSKIKRGHLGQFLAHIQGSFNNVRVNDNSKDVTPEDIQNMVMENRYNTWRHDRSKHE